MSVTIEKIDFKGWPSSYLMTNGEVELVVTEPDRQESTWQNRGGHRLSVAPEAPPASTITYAADNFPVHIKLGRGTIVATPPHEREAGLQKQIVVRMAAGGGGIEVVHRITNRNAWTVQLAVWALSVVAPGGIGITGLPPRGAQAEILRPTNPLVMWAFTDLSDKRWRFTRTRK